MAEIKRLIQTHQLQTTLLRQGKKQLFFKYDEDFDALIIKLVPPEVETVVHYVDDHVGLLYTPEDLEIVGIQVEAFEHSFLPEHDKVQHVWKLSDTGNYFEDVGDLIFAVEKRRPEVACEIAQATRDIPGVPAAELEQAFACA